LQLIWSRVVGMDTNSLQIVPSVHGSTIDLSACPCIIPWRVSRCHNSDANVSMYAGMLAYIQCCLVAQCTSAVQQSFLCNRFCRALLNATSLTSTSNRQNLIIRLMSLSSGLPKLRYHHRRFDLLITLYHCSDPGCSFVFSKKKIATLPHSILST
jgi:hypothetical protein